MISQIYFSKLGSYEHCYYVLKGYDCFQLVAVQRPALCLQAVEIMVIVSAGRTMLESSATTVRLDTMSTLSARSVLVIAGDQLTLTSVTRLLDSVLAREASEGRTATCVRKDIMVFPIVLDVGAIQRASSQSQEGLLVTAHHPIL